ncbi:ABC transporter substrate-binding protein [Aestuariirhabdus sp. LZHN29]|uniref:ABC transporter substrate-binding protein n=1 Tax=Aestuariirhabdus sp. LZHN29 TaxID=3417462 RepID=UPI003CF6E06B
MVKQFGKLKVVFKSAALTLAASAAFACPVQADTLKVGLVAALSGQSAKSGEAITRGLTVAIDEINAAGGILGQQVELIRRDDESNPSKGLLATRELIQKEGVSVIFGGLDTPVSLAIVPVINKLKVPYVGTWAAGTPITKNGAKENYAFRVSAVDEIVDEALLSYALKHYGTQKPGMILINNPWGESNEKGLTKALDARGMSAVGIERIEGSDVDVVPQLTRLKEAGVDTLFMVANVSPSAQVVKSLERMGWDVPIVSHWGPAGGRFSELAGPNADQVEFIQTYVFSAPGTDARSDALFASLQQRYPEIKSHADVTPAVGIANAYDAMYLTAKAIELAGSTEGPAIRKGFYSIDQYDGLIKNYQTPFTPDNHDALGPDDYVFTHFVDGSIVVVKK